MCGFLVLRSYVPFVFFFFFNDTATTEIYTLSLHDALPICLIGIGFCHDPCPFFWKSAVLRRRMLPQRTSRTGADSTLTRPRFDSDHGALPWRAAGLDGCTVRSPGLEAVEFRRLRTPVVLHLDDETKGLTVVESRLPVSTTVFPPDLHPALWF